MKRKTISLMLLISITLSVYVFTPSFVIASIDPGEVSADASDINVHLQEDYFKDRVQGSTDLKGLGLEGSNVINPDYRYIPASAMTLAGLYTRYVKSGNAVCKEWADGAVYNTLNSLADNMMEQEELSELEDPYKVFLTTDQGIALEFMSVAYDQSGDQNVLNLLENLYGALVNFESSSSVSEGFDGGYWRAMKQSQGSDPERYKPTDDGWKYCFANASLWAIAGMCKFAVSVTGTTDDEKNEFSTNAVTRAEDVIQFLEDYCYYNGSGFVEYPYSQLTGTKVFKLNTQIVAALAYTRLYQATNEQSYLDKAEMMVEYIITKNFVTTGTIGGAVSEINAANGHPSLIKDAYENALLAYTLLNMYDATGESKIEHLRRAEEIAYFLNENLYDITEDEAIAGYLEELYNGTVRPTMDTRLYTTQALMLIVNEDIMYYERPWFIKYLWWEIIGGIAVLVIIFVIIGIKKKKDVGRKLPKLVKGLVED